MDLELLPGQHLLFVERDLQEMELCNQLTEAYGLQLSANEMRELCILHDAALKNSGRIELGGGILPLLAAAFGDSPYLAPREYAATLAALLELFYQLKNDCCDRLSDEELIEKMADCYNHEAHGSVEFLTDAAMQGTLPELDRTAADEE